MYTVKDLADVSVPIRGLFNLTFLVDYANSQPADEVFPSPLGDYLI